MAFFFLFGLFLVLAFIALSAVVGFKLLIYGRAFLKSDFLSFGFGFLVLVLIFALNPILKNQNEVYRIKKASESNRNGTQKTLERELKTRFWEQFGRENNNIKEMKKRGGYLKSKTFRILCDEVNGRCVEKKNWLKNIIDKNCKIKKDEKSEYFKADTFSAYCKTWINEEYFVDIKQICQKVNKIILNEPKYEPKYRPDPNGVYAQQYAQQYAKQYSNYRDELNKLEWNKKRCQEFYKGKLILPHNFYNK